MKITVIGILNAEKGFDCGVNVGGGGYVQYQHNQDPTIELVWHGGGMKTPPSIAAYRLPKNVKSEYSDGLKMTWQHQPCGGTEMVSPPNIGDEIDIDLPPYSVFPKTEVIKPANPFWGIPARTVTHSYSEE